MISEQKLIQQMQKRKTRIIALCVLVVVYCLLLGVCIVTFRNVMSVVSPTPPYSFETASLAEHLPMLLTTYAELSVAASRLYVVLVLACCLLVVFIVMLIVEIRGQTQARLIVSMWKRLEELEKDVQHEPSGDSSASA
jgi:hypothetical protein